MSSNQAYCKDKQKKYRNGDFYIGELKKGKPNGNGRMIYADKSEYIGSWSLGERNGLGQMIYADKSEYIGSWSLGERNGLGQLKTANYVYNGFWKNDNPNDSGRIEYKNGIIYDGKWNNGNISGIGYVKVKKSDFKGKLKPQILPNKNLYGFIPIDGTLTKDDEIMTGQWSDDGSFNGEVDNPKWAFVGKVSKVNGKKLEIGRKEFKNTDLYWDGTVIDNIITDGVCNAIFNDVYYNGKWENGKFTGSASGNSYYGDLKNNIKHGYGTYYLDESFAGKSKEYFTGLWRDDNPIIGSGSFSNRSGIIRFNIKNGTINYLYSGEDKFSGSIYSNKLSIDDLERTINENIKPKLEAIKEAKRKKEFEYYNNNYAGLIYIAKNTRFSGDFEAGFFDFLFSAKTDAVIVFLPNGKVILKEVRQSTKPQSEMSQSQMIIMALNDDSSHVYDVELSSDNKNIIISKDGYTITPTNNRRNAVLKNRDGREITFTSKNKYIGTTNPSSVKLALGTYYGKESTADLTTGKGVDGNISGELKIDILPNNKFQITETVNINNPLLSMFYNMFGPSPKSAPRTGSYSISDGMLRLEDSEGLQILLGGNALFMQQGSIHAILYRL